MSAVFFSLDSGANWKKTRLDEEGSRCDSRRKIGATPTMLGAALNTVTCSPKNLDRPLQSLVGHQQIVGVVRRNCEYAYAGFRQRGHQRSQDTHLGEIQNAGDLQGAPVSLAH